MKRAPRVDARAVRPRRHAGRHRARPRRRGQRHAPDARPARRCRSSACGRMVGAGARGMVGAAFGIAPGRRRLRGPARRVPRPLRAAPARAHARSSPAWSRCCRRSRPRGLRWGIVTNKAERFTQPLVDGLGLHAARRRVVMRRHHAACQAAPGAAARSGAAHRAWRRPHCVYVGDDLRDVQAGRAAGMPTRRRRWGYLGRRRADRATGAPTWCIETPSRALELAATGLN